MYEREYDSPTYVLGSKNRCRKIGLNPKVIPTPHFVDPEILNALFDEYKEVSEVIHFFFQKFFLRIKGTPILFVLTDNQGIVLDVKGDPTIKTMIQQLGFQPGVKFSEENNGTNSVSLALKMNHPIQLIGREHYHEFLHKTACYTVPFHCENKGTHCGTISIMTLAEYKSPLLLTMLSTVVDSIEREMLVRKKNRELNILNQMVTDTTKTGILMIDKNGSVTEFNSFAEKLTGWNQKKVVGKSILEMQPLGHYIHQVLTYEVTVSDIEIEVINELTNCKTICLFDGMPIYNETGELIAAFGKFRDITERCKAEARVNHMAYHDDLTGLPNRRHFRKKLQQELMETKKNKGILAVFLLDLDRFKIINDTLGHEKGDLLLIQATNRLKEYLRGKAEIFRMGGDEFTIIFPNVTQKTDVISLAEGIIQLFKQPFSLQDYEFHTSTSIGISFYPHDGHEIDSLFSKADTAMYRAKSQGKNNYVIYHSDMEDRFFEKLTFETELRQAIQNNHLELHYQPQIDLQDGKMIGVEALIRWNHPTFGMISPGDFIPLAEEMGMGIVIGEWVLKTACHQLKRWNNLGLLELRVSVNLSPQEFLKPDLVERVKQILLETELEPKFLELEITESMAMDVDRAISILNSLNGLGVQIAIDDFGTGYSSLNYIKNFSIHRLKIDRSFINDITKDPDHAKIVSIIISMAHALKLEVIAEGVETEEQAYFLKHLQCEQAQGYYYSKPLHPEHFEEKFLALSND